jgi:hypothetical protein
VTGPRVSVVVPVHDGEAWVRDFVESLLDQTTTAAELIVDDGARVTGVRTVHGMGRTWLELAGRTAPAAGSISALALGPARVRRRLRGR